MISGSRPSKSKGGILPISQQLRTAEASFLTPDETSHMLTVPRVLRLLPSLFQRREAEALRIQAVRETLTFQTGRVCARSHRSIVVAVRPVQFNQLFNKVRVYEWAVCGYSQHRIGAVHLRRTVEAIQYIQFAAGNTGNVIRGAKLAKYFVRGTLGNGDHNLVNRRNGANSTDDVPQHRLAQDWPEHLAGQSI